METTTALGGKTFRLTRNNNFYYGRRRVWVTDPETLEQIRLLFTYDNVFALMELFRELEGRW